MTRRSRIAFGGTIAALFLVIASLGIYGIFHPSLSLTGSMEGPAVTRPPEGPRKIDPTEVDSVAYEELIPSFELLIKRECNPVGPSQCVARFCNSVRDLDGDLDVLAFLILEHFAQKGPKGKFAPYLGNADFPKGVFTKPEIREAILSFFEEAKRSYLELKQSTN